MQNTKQHSRDVKHIAQRWGGNRKWGKTFSAAGKREFIPAGCEAGGAVFLPHMPGSLAHALRAKDNRIAAKTVIDIVQRAHEALPPSITAGFKPGRKGQQTALHRIGPFKAVEHHSGLRIGKTG